MRVRFDALAISLMASLLLAAPAWAATNVPAGCSAAAIPNTPVKGTVGGKPFVPTIVSMQIGKGFAVNDVKFDSYDLMFQVGNSIFNALTTRIIVREGGRADGKTFRMLETDSIGDQPAAIKGVPEVQSWDLQLESADVDTSFTRAAASMRLEFGQRKGNVLPGKISFCVPSVKATITGTFNATITK